MSATTIRLYQERYGKAQTIAEKLRVQAGDLRRRAAALLAQSNELEELADTAEAHRCRDPRRCTACINGQPRAR